MRTWYKEKKDKQVYKVFPVLYKKCELCKMRFKFEGGWKYIESQAAGMEFEYRNLYLCKKCFPEYKQALEYFKGIFGF